MKATLDHRVHCCHGDDRPDCPILETLAKENIVTFAPPNGRLAVSGTSSVDETPLQRHCDIRFERFAGTILHSRESHARNP